ncbi:microfibril-associated glycoprotein 4-like [Branchiostoma floridae]|uniref:Microfibril-associated glycoprotein 4-like n=1 Tax=Branchiostoma floridae TaxID=7739 RepID=A0A9J7M9E9_BRAFL|nr:microfibril-associated glycoprotein 4-like [Branchiostoma floridae]
MANVLLLAAFLLSSSFPSRAQDTSIIISTANTEALESQLTETKEETGRLKNEVDRLSSLVETLLSRVDSLSDELSGEKVRGAQLEQNLTRQIQKLEARLQTQCCSEMGPSPQGAETTANPRVTQVGLASTTVAGSSGDAQELKADCAAYKASGQTTSGVYPLGSLPSGVQAYCDMETAGGGWTVIQRRQDGSVPFNRTWEEYKLGFGNKSGEYWLGNENIHLLTNQKKHTLRIDLQDWEENQTFAEYSTFRVSGESDGYRLHISGYSGTAGDSMTYNNGERFSTVDRDNDVYSNGHCSQQHGQGGWWFWQCSYSILNGRYLGNCGSSCPAYQGVVWHHRRGVRYSLKSVSMKIRAS